MWRFFFFLIHMAYVWLRYSTATMIIMMLMNNLKKHQRSLEHDCVKYTLTYFTHTNLKLRYVQRPLLLRLCHMHTRNTNVLLHLWISIYLLKLTLKWTKQHMNVLDADEWWHHHLAVMSFRHPCRGSNQHWNNAFQLATNKFQLQIWWICIVSISSTVSNKKKCVEKIVQNKRKRKRKKNVENKNTKQ